VSSFDDERKAIESRFATAWAAGAYAAVPVAYENAQFDPPENAPYVVVTIRPADGNQESLGSGTQLSRYLGVILISILVPSNTGQALARNMADAAATMFRRAQFSAGSSGTITCRIPYMNVLGVQDGMFRIEVTADYQRDIFE